MVLRGIEISKRRGVMVELITQHKHKMPTIRQAFIGGLLLRHFSLQYFTSVQFFAHTLRQVITLPQTAQGLLGSEDLLPLNPVFNVNPAYAA